MITINWNKEVSVECDVEVEEKLDKISDFMVYIAIIVFNLVILTIPIVYMIISGFSIPVLTFLIVWVLWASVSLYKINDVIPTHLDVVLRFPLIFPSLMFIKLCIYNLKKRYANSYDLEEIKKFERKRKIKSIL